MNYLKMLDLAAVAAMALMAFVGVGSASAVTLCKENVATGCSSHVNDKQEVDFSAEDSIKLAGPFGITLATCTGSTVKASTARTGADDTTTAVTANVTSLTFTGCNRPTTPELFGSLSITASGTEGNGTVSSNGVTVMIHEVPNIIGNPSTCAYKTTETDIGKLTHSATAATFDIEATIVADTEKCPNGTWSGHYVSTAPTIIKAVAH